MGRFKPVLQFAFVIFSKLCYLKFYVEDFRFLEALAELFDELFLAKATQLIEPGGRIDFNQEFVAFQTCDAGVAGDFVADCAPPVGIDFDVLEIMAERGRFQHPCEYV